MHSVARHLQTSGMVPVANENSEWQGLRKDQQLQNKKTFGNRESTIICHKRSVFHLLGPATFTTHTPLNLFSSNKAHQVPQSVSHRYPQKTAKGPRSNWWREAGCFKPVFFGRCWPFRHPKVPVAWSLRTSVSWSCLDYHMDDFGYPAEELAG